MNNKSIMRAIAEAERFLEKAKAAQHELLKEEVSRKLNKDDMLKWYSPSGKILATCKRASMDLSCLLSDLRQNR